MRLSFERARVATRGEKVTLFAVHHLLGLYQRLEDRVSLGQLALSEGLWDGSPAECPESIRNAIGRRLKRLDELGALEYEPARYVGDRGRITLPHAGELRGKSQPGEVGSVRTRANPGSAESQPVERREPTRGARPSEGCTPRYKPEVARSRVNGNVDSPGARHTASPSIDELRGEFVGTLLETYGDEDDLVEDAIAIGDHLNRFLPDREFERVCEELRASPPSGVRLVLRQARRIAEEAGVDLPRLDLSPLKARAR